MTDITLYYGSGSPFAWRVQLALEHKALPYERRVLSFAAGDTRKPEFVALNPRHRVPTIVDGDFVLYESNAIVEYLDEQYAGRGPALFPGDARQRALVRRMVSEVDSWYSPAVDRLVDEATKKLEDLDREALAAAKRGVADELSMFARSLRGDYLAGSLSAADFALYPLVAFLFRVEQKRMPDLGAQALLPPSIAGWKSRMEALPFLDRTIPPHWTEG